MSGAWSVHRDIVERVIVAGMLILETPTHFGNGDVSVVTDMPVMRDAESGRPVLTGSSIAGALRNYLRQINANQANDLFGWVGSGTNADVLESALIVHDSYSNETAAEFRDGVAIDPATRTAEKNKKFDIELIPEGTTFDLRFELEIGRGRSDLVNALATALHGLQESRIGLGKRKTRGFGQCKVVQWRMRRFDMRQPGDLVAWLNLGDTLNDVEPGTDIASLLKTSAQIKKPDCFLTATFALEDSSLLIRSDSDNLGASDTVHLHSRRNGKFVPVLSGTSLAGALRARALRIANTLSKDDVKAWKFVDDIFGTRQKPGKTKPDILAASRLIVHETEITDGADNLVQSRVAIDRFTGGAYPSALFSEQPVFGKKDTHVTMNLELHRPTPEQVGLLLLLLKDLWTSDLPLGGESSVGRGRLHGRSATLEYNDKKWEFMDKNSRLEVFGDRNVLEGFVRAFNSELK